MPQQQQQQQQTRGKEPAGRRYGYNRSYHGHLQQDSAAKMALHSRRYQSKAVLQIEQPSKPMTSNTATQGRNRLPGTGRPSKTPDFITQTDLYAPPPLFVQCHSVRIENPSGPKPHLPACYKNGILGRNSGRTIAVGSVLNVGYVVDHVLLSLLRR